MKRKIFNIINSDSGTPSFASKIFDVSVYSFNTRKQAVQSRCMRSKRLESIIIPLNENYRKWGIF